MEKSKKSLQKSGNNSREITQTHRKAWIARNENAKEAGKLCDQSIASKIFRLIKTKKTQLKIIHPRIRKIT